MQGVVLEWDRNPETNVLGYRVYTGSQSRVYDSVLDVGNQTLAQLATQPGTTFYAVTAYDDNGLESDFSDEVSYTGPAPNSPPVPQPDQYVTTRNLPLTVAAVAGVLANDSDVDGDALSVLLVSAASHGALVLNADGSFIYTPVAGFVGLDSFSYSARDAQGTSAPVSVTITVNSPPNTPPAVQTDQYSATKNISLSVSAVAGVLANDSDLDGDGLVAQLASSVSHGTLSFNADGSFNYTPAQNYVGTDSFSYYATDGKANSVTATVTITVHAPPNSAPNAQPDQYVTSQNAPLHVNAAGGVLVNDSDADNDALTALLVTSTTHGTLQFNADGSFDYSPTQNFVGTDSFSYRASDGAANSAVVAVTITVNGSANSTPTAQPDQYVAIRNTPLNVLSGGGVLANDSDADGDGLVALLSSSVAHGALSLHANGSFTYTPAQNFSGADSFSYSATDGKATSAVVTVTLTVNAPPNSTPTTQPDQYIASQNVPLDIAAISGVLANDSDADMDPLAAILAAEPTQGTLALNSDGSFIYTPAQNFTGSDSFSYQATDGASTSAVTIVTITVNTLQNSTPTAQPDPYVATRNTLLNVPAAAGVLANDSDVDGDTLFALLVGAPAHGVVTLQANGSFIYQPAQNFTGADSFSYQTTDGKATSTVAIVSITVTTPPNSTPTAQPDQYIAIQNATLTVAAAGGVLGNDSDADGDPISAVLSSAPAHGTVSLNSDGSFSYTPAQSFVGADSFSYQATDGAALSAVTAVTITVNTSPNSTPSAQPDQYVATRNTLLTIPIAAGLLANDSDADGDGLIAILATSAAHGIVTLNANGSFTYAPEQGFVGADSFSYVATDAKATSAVAVVTITVNRPAVPPPYAQPDQYVTIRNTLLTVSVAGGVLANDSAGDGGPLSATLVSSPAHGTVSLDANGSFIYTPAQNFIGPDSFTYRANDENAASAATLVTITVNSSPNAVPAPQPDQYVVTRNTSLNVGVAAGVLGNDSDADGDGLIVLLATSVSHGVLSMNANGSFSYVPSPNYVGGDSFGYQATDGKATSAVTTVTLTVNAAPNSLPTVQGDHYVASRNTTLNIPAAGGVLANDSDGDGDTLTAQIVAGAAHGTLALNPNGSFSYTPAPGYTGSDSFSYRASDGKTSSAPAIVNIIINNAAINPPISQPDHYTATKNKTLTIPANGGVLANDVEVNGDALWALLVGGTSHGSLSLNTNGGFSYTPAANFLGEDTFTYRARNAGATSALAVVTIIVKETAPPPTPPPGACFDCFAPFDAVLWSRSNAFRAVIPARYTMPTNADCAQAAVIVFDQVAKALTTINDSEIQDALSATAECLASVLQLEVSARGSFATNLAPSQWTATASNQLAATTRNIDRAMATSNNMSRAKILRTAATTLVKTDRTLANGNLALAAIADRAILFDLRRGKEKAQLKFIFSDWNFVAETMDGTPVATGFYVFTRTKWNQGTLTLEFQNSALGYNAGDVPTWKLQFTRTRHRMTSKGIRGYFTLPE